MDELSNLFRVYLPSWDRGRPAALDVSVISTLQRLTLSRAANVTGYALSVAEDRKRASHEASCRDVGVSFVPLIFESLGGLSNLGCKTLHSIGRQLGLRVGVPISDSILSGTYGEGMLLFGFTVSPSLLHILTVFCSFNFVPFFSVSSTRYLDLSNTTNEKIEIRQTFF